MNEFKLFDDRLAGLIASLSAPSRRQMATEIAKRLRASQQQRIKQQQAPDGTPYAGRKRQLVRGKKGRVKRAMFTKLRTNRFMKAKGAPDESAVEFIGRVQRIAQVHQYGLRDRPSRNGREVQYSARPLLGFSDADRQIVEEVLVSHLSE
ncbi:Mu-like prophage protein gpG [Serratia marcescens]|uniref:phage virion morphogenesis protein n=1 Tax=Serratia TaxID=613 RepID=UPI00074521BE|nr:MULTISPECIES: phage virion morphogenesis protein [Serratia]MBJ2066951.1 phage virion morphogenesis protein [Serratia odorifera]CVC03052.1 Mu-like prophage protein gpG [Serratia marcescens]CVH14762.1 Mu-like prophage protein gpG [Serratia marcescens]